MVERLTTYQQNIEPPGPGIFSVFTDNTLTISDFNNFAHAGSYSLRLVGDMTGYVAVEGNSGIIGTDTYFNAPAIVADTFAVNPDVEVTFSAYFYIASIPDPSSSRIDLNISFVDSQGSFVDRDSVSGDNQIRDQWIQVTLTTLTPVGDPIYYAIPIIGFSPLGVGNLTAYVDSLSFMADIPSPTQTNSVGLMIPN